MRCQSKCQNRKIMRTKGGWGRQPANISTCIWYTCLLMNLNEKYWGCEQRVATKIVAAAQKEASHPTRMNGTAGSDESNSRWRRQTTIGTGWAPLHKNLRDCYVNFKFCQFWLHSTFIIDVDMDTSCIPITWTVYISSSSRNITPCITLDTVETLVPVYYNMLVKSY